MSLRKEHPKEYRIWKAMRARCYAPSNKDMGNYQKKNITVCSRWDSFDLFFQDMGTCPEKHSIDRIDNNGNYTPENCRWATSDIQTRNRGDFNRVYSYKGKTQCLKDWAKELGIKYMTLHMRLLRHPELSFEEAILYENPDSKPIIYEGKEYSRKDLCKKYNIPLSLFYDRYHKGWPIERILKTPKLTSRYDKRNHFTNRTKESTEL